MKLTGKAKERFEKWYSFSIYCDTYWKFGIPEFYILPDSMKFGVYVDFFDSEGGYVDVFKDPSMVTVEFCISIENSTKSLIDDMTNFETRHEARTKVIEKANELLNQKLEQ
jgi:hypothetical protein